MLSAEHQFVFPSAEDKRNTNNFLKARHPRSVFWIMRFPLIHDQITNLFRAKDKTGLNNGMDKENTQAMCSNMSNLNATQEIV